MSDTPAILPPSRAIAAQCPAGQTDDPAALKAMIAGLRAENARIAAENMRVQADIEKISATLRAHEALVQALQIQIARLKKQKFGASSERIEREIEQLELELALEHLEIAGAAAISAIAPDDDAELSADEQAAMPSTPRRRKPLVVEGTPRERIVLDPGDDCPECGGTLRLIGEDVSEILELISAKLKVIETARLKKSCRRCEKITQLPAPSRPIPRSMVGPGLLAHVLPLSDASIACRATGVEVRRSPSALSPKRDTCPDGRKQPGLDPGRLVRPGRSGAGTASRTHPRQHPGLGSPARALSGFAMQNPVG